MLTLNAVFHLLPMPQNNERQAEQNLMSLNFHDSSINFFHNVMNLL